MNTPRKHHYLPKFYLKEFSSNDRNLMQIDKATGHTAICAVNDLATIRIIIDLTRMISMIPMSSNVT